MSDPILDARAEKLAARKAELAQIVETAKAEKRVLTDDETDQFDKLEAKIKADNEKIAARTAEIAREVVASKAAAGGAGDPVTGGAARVGAEPQTYRENGQYSYLKDIAALAVAARRLGGSEVDPHAALERLQRSQQENEVELRDMKKKDRQAFERFLDASNGSYEKRVNPNTTAGTGGEFVPPLWLVSSYIPFMRAGRVAANRVKNMPLPPGIDIINIPKLTLGSLTGIQTANAAAVTSQDITTSTVSASVRTIAGQEDISLQLLEQSPLSLDGVIFDDLSRDYDKQLDTQILSGSGNSGQHKGVLSVTQATSNTDITKANGVTVASTVFFDGSTSGTQYRSVVNGVNQIETLRFDNPTAIWAHPRRVNSWALAADAATGRPLFLASKYGQYNTVGTAESSPIYQGVAGELFGLPVVKDANMSTTMNATAVTGGTADPIVVLKEDDVYLWEGALRMRALPEILSGTLQIRFQLYAYSAFMPDRFPCAISILTGNTGLAAPGF